MAEGKNIDETNSLRIDGLFLAFIIITLLYGRLTAFLDKYLKGRTRRGLRHAVHHIEEELLALGLISLLLIATEEYLVQICVDEDKDKDDSTAKDKYKKDTLRRLSRKLLAGGDDGGGGDGSCSKGEEPFWSAQTIHQTHIFIFLIAVTHVLYATVSILLCLWRMRRWRKYEERPDHAVKQLDNTRLIYGQNTFEYWFWSFWAQFVPSVDESLYLSMRFLFIERMEFPDDFDFLSFVTNALVEEFAIVVKTDWVMWLIAAVWILVPPFLLITSAAAVIIVLILGTKLEVVGVKLTQLAYLAYRNRDTANLQPITAPTTFLKKSVYYVGQKLTRSTGSQSMDGVPPNLATQSLSIFRPSAAQPETEDVVRRAHSFEDNKRVSISKKMSKKSTQKDEEIEPSNPAAGESSQPKTEPDRVEKETALLSWCGALKDSRVLKKTDSTDNGVPDSANLFWFKNPQLTLIALRFVYFETAMAIAVVLFDSWQDSEFIIEDTDYFGNKYLMMAILIGVGVLCLLQTSFLMLPTYALTTVAGSHCPETILNIAKKMNIETTQVELLHNKSGQIEPLVQSSKEEHHGDMHDEQNTISSLVGAMYRGKLQRLARQESRVMTDAVSGNTERRKEGQCSNENSSVDDEEMIGIAAVFGSFEAFLEDVRRAQLSISQMMPAALFNFDCDVGSFDGKESTQYDRAAINLTWDLRVALNDGLAPAE